MDIVVEIVSFKLIIVVLPQLKLPPLHEQLIGEPAKAGLTTVTFPVSGWQVPVKLTESPRKYPDELIELRSTAPR